MLRAPRPSPSSQQGVVLLISLIVLVIMALASVALMRSVSTANVIAGNLAFQQAATTSGDQGVETAVAWLENNNGQSTSSTANTCASGSSVLACDQGAQGYIATRTDPTNGQAWSDLWTTLVAGGHPAVALPTDSAGNTVSYLIQRMCSGTGDANTDTNRCSTPPATVECGSSKTLDGNGGGGNLACTGQVYYRITVQVSGPRSTRSYVQAMVAL